MTFSSSLLGKEYPLAEGLVPTPADAQAYRDALGWLAPTPPAASTTENDAGYQEVPTPWLAARCLSLQCAPLLDPAHTVDLMRFSLVAFGWRAAGPIATLAPLSARARVAEVEARGGLHAMRVDCEVSSAQGEERLSARAGFAVRGARQKRAWLAERSLGADALAAFRDLPLLDEQRWQPPAGCGARLAAAVGDPNPIYADVEVARMAGLPGPLTPPFYLSCWVYEALNRRLGAQTRLVGMRCELDRPSLAGAPMTLEVRARDAHTWEFALWGADGAPLLKAGVAEFETGKGA